MQIRNHPFPELHECDQVWKPRRLCCCCGDLLKLARPKPCVPTEEHCLIQRRVAVYARLPANEEDLEARLPRSSLSVDGTESSHFRYVPVEDPSYRNKFRRLSPVKCQ